MGGFLPGLGGSGEPSTGGGGGVRAARLGSQKEETCRPGTLGAPPAPLLFLPVSMGISTGNRRWWEEGGLQVPGLHLPGL